MKLLAGLLLVGRARAADEECGPANENVRVLTLFHANYCANFCANFVPISVQICAQFGRGFNFFLRFAKIFPQFQMKTTPFVEMTESPIPTRFSFTHSCLEFV